jgi:hypothetical protein
MLAVMPHRTWQSMAKLMTTNWKTFVKETVAATMEAATVKSVWPAVKACAECGAVEHPVWVLPDRTVRYCAAWKKDL